MLALFPSCVLRQTSPSFSFLIYKMGIKQYMLHQHVVKIQSDIYTVLSTIHGTQSTISIQELSLLFLKNPTVPNQVFLNWAFKPINTILRVSTSERTSLFPETLQEPKKNLLNHQIQSDPAFKGHLLEEDPPKTQETQPSTLP